MNTKPNLPISVGSLVSGKQRKLVSGGAEYPHAVVVQVEPLVLISETLDMTWMTFVADDVYVVGYAIQSILRRCINKYNLACGSIVVQPIPYTVEILMEELHPYLERKDNTFVVKSGYTLIIGGMGITHFSIDTKSGYYMFPQVVWSKEPIYLQLHDVFTRSVRVLKEMYVANSESIGLE